MSLDKEQVQALESSIEHWVRMRDDKCIGGEMPISEDCACCQYAEDIQQEEDFEWEDDHGMGCTGCPIYEYTGEPDCAETPYYQAMRIQSSDSDYNINYKDDAQEMVTFLRDVLRNGLMD